MCLVAEFFQGNVVHYVFINYCVGDRVDSRDHVDSRDRVYASSIQSLLTNITDFKLHKTQK